MKKNPTLSKSLKKFAKQSMSVVETYELLMVRLFLAGMLLYKLVHAAIK